MKKHISLISAAIVAVALTGCAAKPIIAQPKNADFQGKNYEFAGVYMPDDGKVTLTINGDPLMSGKFPPYTPKLILKAKYADHDFEGNCYFGSILGNQGGAFGIVASAIQNAKSSSADRCDMYISGQKLETLFF